VRRGRLQVAAGRVAMRTRSGRLGDMAPRPLGDPRVSTPQGGIGGRRITEGIEGTSSPEVRTPTPASHSPETQALSDALLVFMSPSRAVVLRAGSPPYSFPDLQ
jgi:hypothetical protein